MKLKPELYYIQHRLVLAAHPWLSWVDALRIESKIDWCIKLYNNRTQRREPWEECEIVWLPPTLARVLNGLGQNNFVEVKYNKGGFIDVKYWDIQCLIFLNFSDNWIEWKLLNDDWSEMTLFEQSNETISAIARELWYNSLQS